MIRNLLCACAAFSWIIETNVVSIFLLGEYPYPTKDEKNLD